MTRPQIIAPAVEARPTPGFTRSTNVPEAMFGGGQGLAQAGQALTNIAAQMKAEDDTAKIQDGDNGDADWYRNQLQDPNGFWSRQGLDAQAALPAYQESVKKRIEETAATMANETQRKAYLATANRRAQMWLDRASNHVADQRKIGLDQNDDARLANLAKDAASFWGDEDGARAFMDAGTNTILDKANRNGWSPEVTRQALDMWRAQARAGQIKQALAADPDRAAQMVEDHRAELGAAYPDLRTQVTAATKARTVDRAVNTVMENPDRAGQRGGRF